MFTCSRCKQDRPAEMFYTSGGRRSGYCRDCQKAYTTERRKSLEVNRSKARRRRYGISPEGYAALLLRQDGVCAICGAPPKPERYEFRGHDALVIDHDHMTGLVRGLICNPCNILLGRVKDDVGWMEAAVRYLRTGAAHVVDVLDVVQPGIPAVVAAEPVPTPDVDDWLPEPESLGPRARCADADRMPSDGDEKRPTSNFQHRRKAQIEALQAGYTHCWPGNELSVEAAKELLRLTQDCAEDVYDAFERNAFRKLDYPAAYVRKLLTASPPTRQASDSEPLPNELPDPTPEQRAKWKRNDELLRKAGLIPLDGGDRW